MNAPQNILRRVEIERMTGLPKSSLYAKIASGTFPKPVKLSARAVGWLEKDIVDWQQGLAGARAS